MAFSFEGIKFYLSIHTPNRIKKDIQNNGGIVVADERNADVRIVDPSRSISSHRTGDFYSHQWITDCIRQKRRIDETPYLISTVATRHRPQPQEERSPRRISEGSRGLVYAPARPLAPSQKRTRNAFTYEDDRILKDWVTREAEKAVKKDENFHDRGNDIYKRLEEKYPHHTFHSWRNRWLTKLSMTTSIPVAKHPRQPQRRPQAEPQEQSGEETGDLLHAQPQEPQEQPQEEPQEQQREEAQDRTQEDSAHDDNSGRPGDLFFMDYTDYFILAKAYAAWKKERRESGVSAKPTTSFFKDLHEKCPDISRTELRRRYYRLRDLYTKADAAPAGAPAEEAPAETRAGPGVNHQSEVQREEQDDEQGGADENDNDNDNDHAADGLDLDEDAILNGVGDLDSDQQNFQKCLDEYNHYLEVYVPPSFFIGGRYLETYSLWTAMQSATDEHDRINWDAVVNTLGLDSTKFPHLASQLAAWYELNLKEFGSFLKRYMEEAQNAEDSGSDDEGGDEDEDEDEDEEEEEAAEGTQEPPSAPAPGSARRSTGLMASLRGFLTGETTSDAPAPESPSKHVRFSGAQPGDEDDDDNGSPAFETRRRTRSATQQRTPKKKALEPETQDFAFDPKTQAPTDLGGDDNEEEGDSAGDDGEDWETHGTPSKATPARQLRSEERIVAAVPQSLPAPRSAKRKQTAAISTSASPSKRQQRKSMSAV